MDIFGFEISGDGVSVDLGRCPVIESLLVSLPVVEDLDVVEQDRAREVRPL